MDGINDSKTDFAMVWHNLESGSNEANIGNKASTVFIGINMQVIEIKSNLSK